MRIHVPNFKPTIAAAVVCSLTACSAGSTHFDSPQLEAQASNIRHALSQAGLVFVGRIVSVGPPPQVESGRMIASQQVVYDILELLAGKAEKPRIEVRHLVRPKDPFSAQLTPGKKLIVFAQQKSGSYWAAGSAAGAIPASRQNVQAVKAILRRRMTR